MHLFALVIQLLFFSVGVHAMKRRDIFEIWSRSKKGDRNMSISTYILEKYSLLYLDKVPRVLQVFVSSLSSKIEAKWEQCHRQLPRFLEANEAWLDSDLVLPHKFYNLLPSTSATTFPEQSKVGRPTKQFGDCTLKVQKRKIQDLVSAKSQEELLLAAEVSLRTAGKRDAANIVKELSGASPRRATNIKKARKIFNAPEVKLSPSQALSLLIDAKLTTQQYNTIRQTNKSIGCNIYPPYGLVKQAKKECYPAEEHIVVTEMSAEVNLQALLDLTAKRIFQAQNDVFDQLSNPPSSLQLITKWGCDGSSAQSRYKQTLNDSEYSDEHLFSVTLVPLRLEENESKKVYWQNPRPNSTRYCRLVRFVYKKETKDVIKAEVRQMQEQIRNLVPTDLHVVNLEIQCKHKLIFTMVDGKICSTLSQYDSSQKCYICGASPKEMNDDRVANRFPDEEMYTFGISPLHSWIRCFECLLHIAYKLDIKKWQARSAAEKSLVATKKKNIQEKFRSEMGLLIDMPKQSAGNTNDGNTARRFFRNTEKAAEITGINVDLIHHIHVLLEALSSDYEIDSEKFAAYAHETKDLYLRNYKWYYMPASLHKILHHSHEIIQACLLPLGQLSEEAQEASNKEYRRFREYFSRKTSRHNTNRDVLNRFLLSSDPLLSSYTPSRPKRSHIFPRETIALLKAPEIESTSDSDDDEEDDESDGDNN